jgi:actin-like ATPase involved in cell morphogenesis
VAVGADVLARNRLREVLRGGADMTDGRVYGIDLGTTYTCIAHVDKQSGKPSIIVNLEGEWATPSVVLFENADQVVVGREAKNIAVLESDRVFEMIKRQMGHPEWRGEAFGRQLAPEEIAAFILRKVVDDAERNVGERPHKVVITCPAHFSTAQREATAMAGKIAGLDVLEIINEPTAAAITYGIHDSTGDDVVLVYDLGGGTFDVTVIEIKDKAFRVIATGGNNQLGGRDWDDKIVEYLAAQWRETFPNVASDPLATPETLQDLWQRAEAAKRGLTQMAQVRVAVSHETSKTLVTLTREQFDELTATLLENTITFTKQVIDEAGQLGVPKIDRLLLVGGSTKMPQVQVRLAKEFDIEIKSFEPDHAVAKGAAIYGQKLEVGRLLHQQLISITLTDTPDDVRDAAVEQVAAELGLRLGTIRALDSMVVGSVATASPVDLGQTLEFINWLRSREPELLLPGSVPARQVEELALTFCEDRGYANAKSFAKNARRWLSGNAPPKLLDRISRMLQRDAGYRMTRETASGRNLLDRYGSVKFHGLFLLLSSSDLPGFLQMHWRDLHHLTRDQFDIYYSQSDLRERTSGYEIANELKCLQIRADSLPALLIWGERLEDAKTVPLYGLENEAIVKVVAAMVQEIRESSELSIVVRRGAERAAELRTRNSEGLTVQSGASLVISNGGIVGSNYENRGIVGAMGDHAVAHDLVLVQDAHSALAEAGVNASDGQAIVELARQLAALHSEQVQLKECLEGATYLTAMADDLMNGISPAEHLANWKLWVKKLGNRSQIILSLLADSITLASPIAKLLGLPL